MSTAKKYTPGNKDVLEAQTKRFNKRALIGSFIIHLFFFLIKFPHLELEYTLKEEPKLIPITMTMVTPPPKRNAVVKNVVKAPESEKIPVKEKEKVKEKVKNGTDRAIPNADKVGNKNTKNTAPVQKGDPASLKKEAYKPGTDVRKTPRTSVGSGSAASAVKAVDNNTGGSGDTYKGVDMTNLTDSIRKSGQGLKRVGAKGAKDDGGAGFGTGGGIGNGVGGGGGDGFITGSPNGTPNAQKVATNVGSLTGAAKGAIDSQRGFDGVATKGSVMVAGIPIEKIAVSNINPDDIRRILRDHIPQFRYCYQTELDSNKNPEGVQGRMNFKFNVGGNGRVTKSEIISEEISSDKVRDCIKDVLHGIQFPIAGAGKTYDVAQPINFYPKRI